ncbi:MAG: hypothetical protein JSR99_00020 [Proteobacteria bacterium]|nr:hypothetical protein [Pseudomonadota bacterium]
MSKVTHAFAVALIFECSGERRVAEYCREHGIVLAPVRFVHHDAMGELVALADDVYSIQLVREAAPVQLRML